MTHIRNDASVAKLRAALKSAGPFRGVPRNGHAQTLLGHFLPSPKVPSNLFERVELNLPDGDRLIGFLTRPRPSGPERGYLHIFHGLAGSTDSSYMARTARVASNLGLNAVIWNHRGCGPGRKLAREPYHSGRSDDLARAVRWGREHARRSQHAERSLHGVLGFSLSGNAAILLAAGIVPTMGPTPLEESHFQSDVGGSLPDFAISISPPFDLRKAAMRLSVGPSRIYGQSFLPALLESLDDRSDTVARALEARKKLKLTDTIDTFDACYTGIAGGFESHLDYYARASSGPYLHHAQRPLIVLSADDDPITHGSQDLPQIFDSPFVVQDFQSHGGHMGFVDRRSLPSRNAGRLRWLDERIQLYLRTFLDQHSR